MPGANRLALRNHHSSPVTGGYAPAKSNWQRSVNGVTLCSGGAASGSSSHNASHFGAPPEIEIAFCAALNSSHKRRPNLPPLSTARHCGVHCEADLSTYTPKKIWLECSHSVLAFVAVQPPGAFYQKSSDGTVLHTRETIFSAGLSFRHQKKKRRFSLS